MSANLKESDPPRGWQLRILATKAAITAHGEVLYRLAHRIWPLEFTARVRGHAYRAGGRARVQDPQ
jgi:hypothetical protein